MRKQSGDPLVIGLLGIVAIAAFAYGAFTKRLPFVTGHRIEAVFASANQLRKGSPVRIAGIEVGRVMRIGNGPGTTAIVTLEIEDHGLPVHQDATMRIRPRIFLEGGYFVELHPGSPSAPALDDGGTVPLSQTSVPVAFTQVLGMFDRPTRESLQALLKEAATGLEGGGAEALGRASRPLAPVLRDSSVVAEAARGSEAHDLSGLIGSLSRVTAALAGTDRELADLVTHLSQTSRALASRDRELGASVRELRGVLREAPPALRAVDRALAPLERFSRDVRPALRALPAALEQTSDVLDQVRALVGQGELPALIATLEPLLRDLPVLSDRLRRLFALVTPVTDCVRDRAVPVLEAKLDDGDLSTGRPVWQELAHAFVGLASASQSFDANGPHIRYLAGGGDQIISTGPVPGLGALVGRGALPILGSRPRWLGRGVTPPFGPHQPCRRQAPPDLQARTDLPGATSSRRAPSRTGTRRRGEGRLSRPELERLLDRIGAPRSGRHEGRG